MKKSVYRTLVSLFILLVFMPGFIFAGGGGQAQGAAAPAGADAPVTYEVMVRGMPSTFGVPRTVEINTKYLKANYNIDLKYEMVDNNTYNDKVTARFAAGDFPSVLYYGNASVIQNAIDSKVFVPVTEAVMSPSLDHIDRQAFFCRWYQNGEYYGYNYHAGSLQSINLRGDWLDNLGMKMPTNAAELKETIMAMTFNDPDKNGKNDTFGYSIQGDLGFTGELWTMWLPGVKTAPSSNCGLYIDFKTGVMKSVLDEVQAVKAGLTWFADLYKAGALDPQFVTRKQLDTEAMFVSGQVGVWVKEIGALPVRLAQLKLNAPNASIRSMPTVRNSYGGTNNDYISYKSDCYFMTKNAPDPSRGYKLLNYLWGEKGIYTEAYGEEGVEYSLAGGQFKWLDPAAQQRSSTPRVVSSYLRLKLLEPIPVITDNQLAVEGYNLVNKDVLTYATEAQSFIDLNADIGKTMLEGIISIIVGERPISDYDALLAEVKQIGLDKVVADVNAVYQRMK